MGSHIHDQAAFRRRLITALRDAEKSTVYPPNLSPNEATEEIDLWVQDQRQWRKTRGNNWESLLLDLDDAIDATGGALAAAGLEVAATRTALTECAAVLARSGDNSPDEDLRQRLTRQTRELRKAAADADALRFAFDALVDAASRGDQELGTARVLLDLTRTAGRDPHMVASQIADLVHGKQYAVSEARNALADDDVGETVSSSWRPASTLRDDGSEHRFSWASRWSGWPFGRRGSIPSRRGRECVAGQRAALIPFMRPDDYKKLATSMPGPIHEAVGPFSPSGPDQPTRSSWGSRLG